MESVSNIVYFKAWLVRYAPCPINLNSYLKWTQKDYLNRYILHGKDPGSW